jgi:pimeloyl-ACP methyl ester carboxylesterase
VRRHVRHRNGHVSEDGVGNAAVDEAPQAAAPVGRHHDQADLHVGRGFEDRRFGLRLDDSGQGNDAALRHPDRTVALVMMSAKSQTPPSGSPLQEAVFESIFRSDYIYWAVSQAARPFLLAMLGVSADVQDRTTGHGQRLISAATDGMNPISLRRDGIYHDRATLNVLPEDVFPLGRITVPTLVVHAVDDGLQPFEHGQNTATRVRGAQLVSYERGGHLLSLQIDDAREQVRAFIRAHSESSNSRTEP